MRPRPARLRRVEALSLVVTGAVLGVVATSFVRPALATREAAGEPCPKPAAFREVYRHVRNLALEEPDEEALYRGAVNGMLGSLDPYSRLIPAEEWKVMRQSTRGEVAGVGLELSDEAGRIVTGAPSPGSSAANAGLHAGEAVLTIDGRKVRCLSAARASMLLSGAPGSRVTVEVAGADGRPKKLSLVREKEASGGIDSRLYGGEIGYLRIALFDDGVAAQAKDALLKLHARAGAKFQGLILDLRHDPGGLLEEAVGLADLFVPHGTLVTAMERGGRHRQTMSASGGASETGYPLVILVDGRTASAAEAFTAALRESHRALVVGGRTLGKGTVQDYVPLEDGSVLEITKARYLTPSGRSLDGVGLEPDLPVASSPGDDDLALRGGAYALRHWSELQGRLASLPNEPAR